MLLAAALVFLCTGCSRFHRERHEIVYVSARQMYLHDRVAPVSNRVAQVANGQQLEVLEHGRRFLKVKTDKNEIGWIEERATITAKAFEVFAALAEQHKQDPVIASGVLRDDLYLHIAPGRDTDHFYLLPGNAKVQLLQRASVAKTAPGASAGKPAAKTAPKGPVAAAQPVAKPAAPAAKPAAQNPAPVGAAPAEPETQPVPLEDWWLVRDAQGRTGWLLAGRIDVEVPDEIGTYAEGQRIVGAYVLAKVMDPESAIPSHEVPEYVTLLSPPKAGLPYDFDQVRVFTWSVRHHRYETAFRVRPIQGYLPLKIGSQPMANGSAPTFSFQIANGPNVATDAQTGIARPAATRTISYMMVDTTVKRTGPDMGPLPTTHSADSKPGGAKEKKGKPVKKKGR